MSNTPESRKRRAPQRSVSPASSPSLAADRAPAAHTASSKPLSVTPACEGVYVYSVSDSSDWTTTDLLCVLHDLVQSSTELGADSADEPSTA